MKIRVLRYFLPLLFTGAIFAENPADAVKKSIECDALKCQPCQADPCDPCCRLIPAYNAPSRPELRCSWDLYVKGSIIYWQAIQENMELADEAFYPTSFATSTAAVLYKTLNFDNKYKPGFKVDFGFKFGYDNWDLFAEYTWYHTNHMTTKAFAPGVSIGGLPATGFTGPVLLSRTTGTDGILGTATDVFNTVTRQWKLKLDFIDLMLARNYFVGKKLTLRPAFGARAAYIRQSIILNQLSNDTEVGIDVTHALSLGTNNYSANKMLSWGYGLRGLLEVDYLLGGGFRMLGNGSFDLLYTRYNLTNNFNSPNLAPSVLTASKQIQKHADFLRPHAELEFGFGWGGCSCGGKWYFDIEAAYGFQVFWDQNMSLDPTDTTLPANDLFLHGGRFSIRVDF